MNMRGEEFFKRTHNNIDYFHVPTSHIHTKYHILGILA